jgi:hypothetical protein
MRKRYSDWYVPPDVGVQIFLLLFPIVAGVLAALLLPSVGRLKEGVSLQADVVAFYCAGLAAAVVGVFLLFLAKLPLYRQRMFWTFGPGALDRTHRRVYWLAYLLFVASVVLLGVVWLKVR